MFDTETFNDKVSLEFTCVILLLFTNPIDGLDFHLVQIVHQIVDLTYKR